MITQQILKDFQTIVRKKYKGIVQEIVLEHCTDKQGDYINFNVLRIKPNNQNKGYGSLILSEVLRLADVENVRIRLLPTNLWGSDLKRLKQFCQKHGFVPDGDRMIYYPQKIF
jgi:GNAT superfamily N-acetyltransferase